MTGVVPNNPPALPDRDGIGISSNKHDLDGSDKSTISLLSKNLNLSDGIPVQFSNGWIIVLNSNKDNFKHKIFYSL